MKCAFGCLLAVILVGVLPHPNELSNPSVQTSGKVSSVSIHFGKTERPFKLHRLSLYFSPLLLSYKKCHKLVIFQCFGADKICSTFQILSGTNSIVVSAPPARNKDIKYSVKDVSVFMVGSSSQRGHISGLFVFVSGAGFAPTLEGRRAAVLALLMAGN
jgi:hypothetical protein